MSRTRPSGLNTHPNHDGIGLTLGADTHTALGACEIAIFPESIKSGKLFFCSGVPLRWSSPDSLLGVRAPGPGKSDNHRTSQSTSVTRFSRRRLQRPGKESFSISCLW